MSLVRVDGATEDCNLSYVCYIAYTHNRIENVSIVWPQRTGTNLKLFILISRLQV